MKGLVKHEHLFCVWGNTPDILPAQHHHIHMSQNVPSLATTCFSCKCREPLWACPSHLAFSRRLGRTYEKLSMGWPTWEMCTSSRYWKGCSVGKVPAPGGSDSQVPSIQDSGSTTGFILGDSRDKWKRQSVAPFPLVSF